MCVRACVRVCVRAWCMRSYVCVNQTTLPSHNIFLIKASKTRDRQPKKNPNNKHDLL